MNRRQFLQSLAAATSVAAMPGAFARMTNALSADAVQWASGWQSVQQTEFTPLAMTLKGTLPQGIEGVLFRNGPALSERAGMQSHHWFDGDGMIQRFSIQAGRIVHQGKMVHTERFLKEQEAQRFLYPQAGTFIEDSLPVRNNDTTNQANIAVLPWNGELLALWEGGSAYRLDPETLETLGRMDWRDDLMHMPFSAHPLLDKGDQVWNFGYAPYAGQSGMLFIYDMSKKAGMKRVQPVNLPFAGYIHDFAQTEQHLIFLVPPYHYEHHRGRTYMSRFRWQPDLGSRLLIVNKNDLTQQQWFELPAGFVFHFGNAWYKNSVVGVNLCWYDDASLIQSSRQARINDQHRPLSEQAKVKTLFANLSTGKIAEQASETVMEFPCFNGTAFSIDSELLGVGVTERNGQRADSLTAFNPRTGKSQHFRYPDHVVAEEPLEVTSREDGSTYVLQTYLDMQKVRTGLNIFRREAIQQGPVVTAEMERHLPLGFHGSFVRG